MAVWTTQRVDVNVNVNDTVDDDVVVSSDGDADRVLGLRTNANPDLKDDVSFCSIEDARSKSTSKWVFKFTSTSMSMSTTA